MNSRLEQKIALLVRRFKSGVAVCVKSGNALRIKNVVLKPKWLKREKSCLLLDRKPTWVSMLVETEFLKTVLHLVSST